MSIADNFGVFGILSKNKKNVLHQTAIETINLPSQISLICEGAFSQCTNLKTINLKKFFTSIGKSWCAL